MSRVQTDPIFAATKLLRQKLADAPEESDSRWMDKVHDGLARLSDAIQAEIHSAERSREELGDINPDFQNVPGTERRLEKTRKQFIQLGEQVHQLRADLRDMGNVQPLDVIQMRLRCEELLSQTEKVSRDDDRVMLEAANSNPGAGE